VKGRPIFAAINSGYAFLLGALLSVCGRTISKKTCKEPKSKLVTEISSHIRFFWCLQLLRGRWMFNSNHWSKLTAGIIVVGRCGRSWYMLNRYLCKQLRLGKNRSHQFVSIDMCLCYVCSLTCEKLVFVSAYCRPEQWVHEDLYRQFSFVPCFLFLCLNLIGNNEGN
jgi:hypothetical protein